MLLCDLCNRGFHLKCIKLPRVPKGAWFCKSCISSQSAASPPPPQEQPHPYSTFNVKGAQDLNGTIIRKKFGSTTYSGVVTFLGVDELPYAFRITYEDGDQETMTLATLKRHL